MKNKWIYIGVKPKEFNEIKLNGIKKGTVFTTDSIMARKHGKLIAVPFSKSGFKETSDNNVFRKLRIKERYFVTKRNRKKFIEVGILE